MITESEAEKVASVAAKSCMFILRSLLWTAHCDIIDSERSPTSFAHQDTRMMRCYPTFCGR
jgi:hypothetical protein